MAQVVKQLGQLRPADLNAASVYATIDSFIVKSIIVCNTSGAVAAYRIFHDSNGTTYDQTTALFYDIPIAANTTHTLEFNLMDNDATGNIAVRTSVANAITFTVYGSEIT